MPYYHRADRLSVSIASLERWYYGEDMEIVIVDDGSPDPLTLETVLDVSIIVLPGPKPPKNPCLPINEAVRHAKGEHIVITSPEIKHKRPALHALFDLYAGGRDVVSAPCWDPDRGWIAGKNSPTGPKIGAKPAGADFPFCTLLSRDFFYEAGGYDEDYRNGQGYDDNDFLWRLEGAGAHFKCSDVEVVHHHEKTEWNMKSNQPLFRKKWPDLFT